MRVLLSPATLAIIVTGHHTKHAQELKDAAMDDAARVEYERAIRMYRDSELSTFDTIRALLPLLTGAERVAILDGYCRHCGTDDNGCQCANDE